jgi:hypothetical protein
VEDLPVRQLGSSVFDALVAVLVIVGVPAAAINREPWVVAVAAAAVLLLVGRIVIERTRAKRAGR